MKTMPNNYMIDALDKEYDREFAQMWAEHEILMRVLDGWNWKIRPKARRAAILALRIEFSANEVRMSRSYIKSVQFHS